MHHLRQLIIAIAAICALALGVFALVTQLPEPDPGDVIIIKGGSLELQCGRNHNTDCLGTNDNMGKYKHKQATKHVTRIRVKRTDGVVVFDSDATPVGTKPEVDIVYK